MFKNMRENETKKPCGAVCTVKDCKICEQEELGGYCVCIHSDAENLEKALEVYSNVESEENYPFCDIVVQALEKEKERRTI